MALKLTKSIFLFVLISFSTRAQIFNKSILNVPSLQAHECVSHLYDTINGGVVLYKSNLFSSGSTFIITLVGINKFGDTLWSKKINTTSQGLHVPVTLTRLKNGNFQVIFYKFSNNQNDRMIIRRYNSSGNLIKTDSILLSDGHMNNGWFQSTEIDNNGNYYIGYRNDSLDFTNNLNPLTNQPNAKFLRLYIAKLDSNNNFIWRKQYSTYVLLNMGNPSFEIIRSLILTSNNYLIASFGNRLEKLDLNGNLISTISNLFPSSSIYSTYYDNILAQKDSTFLIQTQVNDTAVSPTCYRAKLIRFNSNLQVIDSLGTNNTYHISLVRLSNGDILSNYYTFTFGSINGLSSGLLLMKSDLSIKSYYPFNFGYDIYGNGLGYYSTGKLTSNSSGGAFYSTIYNAGNQSLLKYISIDSLFNSYPNKIVGKYVIDTDKNCTISSGDFNIYNNAIQAINNANQNYLTFPNSNGNYTLNLPSGTFSIQQQPLLNKVISCSSMPLTVNLTNGALINNNCFDTINVTVKDIEINSFLTSSMPNDTTSLYISVKNSGGNNFNGVLKVKKDPIFMQHIYSSPNYNLIVGDTIFFNLINLKPDSVKSFYLQYNVASSITNSDTLQLYTNVAQVGDLTPWNNYDSIQKKMALISPKSSNLTKGFKTNTIQVDKPMWINDNETLGYRINYQNKTGKTVKQIVITALLDKNLDIKTFKVVKSSFPISEIKIEEDLLRITYSNLILLDSTISEIASIGDLIYTIKPKQNTPVNTIIRAKAGICFDYTSQIVSNTVINRIKANTTQLIKASGQNKKEDLLIFYPNPVKSYLYLKKDNTSLLNRNLNVSVYNIHGEVIYKNTLFSDDGEAIINLQGLSSGLYIIRADVDGNNFQAKILKE